MTSEQRAVMIDITRLLPRDRKERVSLAPLLAAVNNDKLLKAFGLSLSAKALVAPGKLLPAPVVQYGGNSTVTIEPGKGDWGRESGRMRLVDPVNNRPVQASFMSFTKEVPIADIHKFFQDQTQACKARGINLTGAAKTHLVDLDARAIFAVEAVMKAEKPDVVLCVRTISAV